jgi:hypothetical protein
MINDLIGLNYERRARYVDGEGKSDCFMLVCEVRRRLGLYDYEQDFAWAYDEYEANNLPMKRILRWMLEHGIKTNELKDGNVAIMRMLSGELAVGVVYDGGIITISRGGRSFWTKKFPPMKLFKMKADVANEAPSSL